MWTLISNTLTLIVSVYALIVGTLCVIGQVQISKAFPKNHPLNRSGGLGTMLFGAGMFIARSDFIATFGSTWQFVFEYSVAILLSGIVAWVIGQTVFAMREQVRQKEEKDVGQ